MGSVKIDGAKLNEARSAAKALEESIKSSKETCSELISFLHSAEWSGKSRDAFLTYIEIIHKYHSEMAKAVAKQTKALNHLESYMGDFQSDPSVKEVRNL
ncbi:WXG100 family type VII secretion target [Heyndrickxia acidiproducens]|uniref:WXG100 family type VII secretion target n=1 Tax=Heyndrickxia acidiproducens TaxID=1121084 RepID=UPI00036C4052|nr:WXG100 family type VII secretion target [Heyndrickxia acidiproducens]